MPQARRVYERRLPKPRGRLRGRAERGRLSLEEEASLRSAAAPASSIPAHLCIGKRELGDELLHWPRRRTRCRGLFGGGLGSGRQAARLASHSQSVAAAADQAEKKRKLEAKADAQAPPKPASKLPAPGAVKLPAPGAIKLPVPAGKPLQQSKLQNLDPLPLFQKHRL